MGTKLLFLDPIVYIKNVNIYSMPKIISLESIFSMEKVEMFYLKLCKLVFIGEM